MQMHGKLLSQAGCLLNQILVQEGALSVTIVVLIWIKVFTQNIGVTTNVDAELWVTRDGLTSCINLSLGS